MSRTRTGAVFAIIASVALVVYATLTPGVASSGRVAGWHFSIGATPLTDACSNVLLFVPLGAALVLAGVHISVAAAIGFALSLGVELLQSTGHPVGRYATFADLISNGAGALVGALAAATRARWMRPNPQDAHRLAIGWSALVVGVVTLSAWLLSPIRRADRDAVHNAAPTRSALGNAPGYPWFAGMVTRVVVSGVAVPHAGTGPARVAAPIGAHEVSVQVRGRDSRRAFVPLLYVHDARDTTAYLVVGQLGDDAVARSPRRGDAWGLRMPQLVVTGVFSAAAILDVGVLDNAIGDVTTRQLVATVSSHGLAMREAATDAARSANAIVGASSDAHAPTALSGTATARLDFTPTLGWLMVQPVIGDDETSRTIGTIAWLMLLVIPALFWSGRCGVQRVRVSGVVLGAICGVFLLVPTRFDVAPLPPWQWGTLLAAALIGILLARSTNPVAS